MPTTKDRTSKVATDEDVDLLAGMDTAIQSTVEEDDDESFDLLSEMSESDAVAWVPWNEEDQPNAVQGKVVFIGTVTQDAKYGGEDVPYVEIEDKSGSVTWGIRGYSTVLEKQLQREIDNDLRNGDYLAVVYYGEKTGANNTYKNFKAKSKHIGH